MIRYNKFLLLEEIIFQTEKGSIYKFNNQKTYRYKTKHELHDPKDTGIKKLSDLTIFVTSETAREIGFWGSSSASKKRIVLANNEIYLLSWNDIQGKHGIDNIISSRKYTLNPQLGLSPLELWDRDTYQWDWIKPGIIIFKSSHPGNPIIKIGNVEFPNV